MKKNKFILFTLLILMIFPLGVNALTGDIVVNCNDTTLESGESTTCTVTGKNFSDEISSFHAELSLGDGLTLSSATKDSTWEGETKDGIVDLYTASNKSGSIKFFTFVIKTDTISSDKTVNLKVTDIRIGDSDFKETDFDDSTVNIKITAKNNNNNNDNNDNEDNSSTGDNSGNNNNNDSDTNTDNNDDNNNSNNNSNTNDNENITNNPQTGNYLSIAIIGIMAIALIGALFCSKKVGASK